MSTSVNLCFVWPSGFATFHLTQEEALQATIALRTLGLGLTYKKGHPLITTHTEQFAIAERILRKEVKRSTT